MKLCVTNTQRTTEHSYIAAAAPAAASTVFLLCTKECQLPATFNSYILLLLLNSFFNRHIYMYSFPFLLSVSLTVGVPLKAKLYGNKKKRIPVGGYDLFSVAENTFRLFCPLSQQFSAFLVHISYVGRIGREITLIFN